MSLEIKIIIIIMSSFSTALSSVRKSSSSPGTTNVIGMNEFSARCRKDACYLREVLKRIGAEADPLGRSLLQEVDSLWG